MIRSLKPDDDLGSPDRMKLVGLIGLLTQGKVTSSIGGWIKNIGFFKDRPLFLS
jgi:hypothetical protein